MRQYSGQNIMEFVIILGLVVVVAVAVLVLMGDNIKSVFSSSSEQVSTFKPFGGESGFESVSYVELSGPPVPYNSEMLPPSQVSDKGIPITYGANGASFNVGSKEVTLSVDDLDVIGEVFDTAGSTGLEDYVADAIHAFVNKYADEIEGDDVPLDVITGVSDRKVKYGTDNGNLVLKTKDIEKDLDSHKDSTFQGKAEVNQITIKMGDHYMFLVNDIKMKQEKDTIEESKNEMGVYMVEGTVDAENNFNGQVSSIDIQSGQTALIDGFAVEGTFDEKKKKDDKKKDNKKKKLEDKFKLKIFNDTGDDVGKWDIKI